MSATWKPLGKAVGILETCVVALDDFGCRNLDRQPRRIRCLAWRPGEDELSDLVWLSMTEAGKKAEAE